MKFKELLDTYIEDEILVERVLDLYPDQKKNKLGYQAMLKELRSLEPEVDEESPDMEIRITHIEKDRLNEVEYEHVNGHSKGQDWAIEYTDWTKWLGWKIGEDTIINYHEIDILAHCLWEMSWNGFTRELVNERLNEINERFEAVEKGEVELIPWEKVKKDLAEKVKNSKSKKDNK